MTNCTNTLPKLPNLPRMWNTRTHTHTHVSYTHTHIYIQQQHMQTHIHMKVHTHTDTHLPYKAVKCVAFIIAVFKCFQWVICTNHTIHIMVAVDPANAPGMPASWQWSQVLMETSEKCFLAWRQLLQYCMCCHAGGGGGGGGTGTVEH